MSHELKVLCAILLLASCSSPGNENGQVGRLERGTPVPDAQALYQMPTPNELFRFVREMNGTGQTRLMSPAVNSTRYNTTPKRALNFGVYATDLVYASSFRLNSEVARYYLTCKKLGGELGIASVFNDGDLARLERNLTQGDSLDVLGNQAYETAYRRMQEEDMGPVLSLVLAGGWVESMHLVLGQVQGFDPADPVVLRITEQKATLDQLIESMEVYLSDEAVRTTRDQLVGIRDIFDTFAVERTPHVGSSTSGKAVLGDDVTVVPTPDGFTRLEEAIERTRAEITRPEDMTEQKNS